LIALDPDSRLHDHAASNFLFFSVKEPKEIRSVIEAAKASNCEAINFLASPMFLNTRKPKLRGRGKGYFGGTPAGDFPVA
jgi:hypothetical protein